MLDILRFWAAIEIALFHARFSDFYHINGYVLADFFFILSGFILGENYFSRSDIRPLQFVKRRFLRLYPLHLLGLIVILLHFLFIKQDIPDYKEGTIYTFFSYVFLTVGLGFRKISDGDWNYPTWAISAEFWANVIFIFYFLRLRKSTVALIGIFGYLLVFSMDGTLDTFFHNYFGFLSSGLVRAIAGLCLGSVLNHVMKQHPYGRYPLWLWSLAEISLIATAYLMLRSPHQPPPINLDFLFIPLFILGIAVFSAQKGIPSLMLTKLRLDILGPIAFAIYVFHRPVIIFIHDILRPEAKLPVFLLILVPMSALIYFLIEKPISQRLMGRVLSERKLE
jgi:peptidoglycan/LPS O-acetylase OafA/YrhL